MPLPDYSPRSDSFGNWYFGGFQMDSQVEAGYGAGTTLTPTQAEFNTFLNSALGSGNWAVSGTNYYFRFNNSYEPLTGTVTTTANYRFAWTTNIVTGAQINTAPTGTPVILGVRPVAFSGFISATKCSFAVANQYGMWIGSATKGATGELSSTGFLSMYFGWVKDPVFATNTSERVRNLIVGQGGQTSTYNFHCTRVASSTSTPGLCVTNSVITCDIATPGANITDLCFLDSNSSYLNIGSAYNALFYPGSDLTIGQLYRIPPSDDPDGNTDQNLWLCAEQINGWNGSAQVANAGYKLIRVWSDNIT